VGAQLTAVLCKARILMFWRLLLLLTLLLLLLLLLLRIGRSLTQHLLLLLLLPLLLLHTHPVCRQQRSNLGGSLLAVTTRRALLQLWRWCIAVVLLRMRHTAAWWRLHCAATVPMLLRLWLLAVLRWCSSSCCGAAAAAGWWQQRARLLAGCVPRRRRCSAQSRRMCSISASSRRRRLLHLGATNRKGASLRARRLRARRRRCPAACCCVCWLARGARLLPLAGASSTAALRGALPAPPSKGGCRTQWRVQWGVAACSVAVGTRRCTADVCSSSSSSGSSRGSNSAARLAGWPLLRARSRTLCCLLVWLLPAIWRRRCRDAQTLLLLPLLHLPACTSRLRGSCDPLPALLGWSLLAGSCIAARQGSTALCGGGVTSNVRCGSPAAPSVRHTQPVRHKSRDTAAAEPPEGAEAHKPAGANDCHTEGGHKGQNDGPGPS
jgi:hypothetical protein